MRGFQYLVIGFCLAAAVASGASAGARARGADATPAGVTTQPTDTDGLVYADAQKHTLYVSPRDKPGESSCYDVRYVKATRTVSSITYYLPEPDKRPTCVEIWPPFLAGPKAAPVGNWTIIQREDGAKQWAFRGRAVYRSALDQAPGDVNGLTSGPADLRDTMRAPITADLGLPPGITTRMSKWGRVLAPTQGSGIIYIPDEKRSALCDSVCRSAFRPVIAPAMGKSQGDWSVVSTGRGLHQWAFRGKPLFAAVRLHDDVLRPSEDVPGWRPAVYNPLPKAPADFTQQRTAAGLAYADRGGHTVYFFSCHEETQDRLFCDTLGTSQTYRLTLCGGPEKCMRTWRPVVASAGSRSPNRTWTVVKVDPATGGRIADSRRDGLSVWAYRGRPLYTYAGDREPGDAYGDGVQLVGLIQAEMLNIEFYPQDRDVR